MERRWERGEEPRASHSWPAETAKSTPNWAASASRYSGQCDQPAWSSPAISRTIAGPRACQPLATGASVRSPRVSEPQSSVPSTNPAPTQAGTSDVGRVKSIGTSRSWVGTAIPSPTSNSTRETTA